MDDPHLYQTPLLTAGERNARILKLLKATGKKAMLFVCGKRIASPNGKRLLHLWSQAGHLLANHSYSHRYFHSRRMSLKRFEQDVMKNHNMLLGYGAFVRFFRFPYLKEGNTLTKRDGMRRWMKSMKYKNGHVTIDASDWYIDQRMRMKLKQSTKTPLKPYRNYYLKHMWGRAQYYDSLAKQLWRRPVKHTILLHHNLLNALFLGDLIQHFASKGWKLTDADKVYNDPLYARVPKRLPSGESLIWSFAREKGLKGLRYPAESGRYEKKPMDALGL
tara:strand:+ start:14546 stop:15370 length:825 start_codon:yes stop_codon:yes gene_type:complete